MPSTKPPAKLLAPVGRFCLYSTLAALLLISAFATVGSLFDGVTISSTDHNVCIVLGTTESCLP